LLLFLKSLSATIYYSPVHSWLVLRSLFQCNDLGVAQFSGNWEWHEFTYSSALSFHFLMKCIW
jgi:hypothetical protein